jgi:NhaA family Na+:H+ antiporter
MTTSPESGRGGLPPFPPEAWEPLIRFARLAGRPLERFLRIQAASGVLLLAAAAIALLWANSPWSESYRSLWHTTLGFTVGSFTFTRTLEWFINDVLMVVFFFVVGLEIRREIHHGELSEWRRAALPLAAALGGMLAPAAIYLLVAGAAETRSGWGVPMATDIAFAVGILALLGKRVPAALRVLLLTLAVIDDLGAIIVIAVFYSGSLKLWGLGIGLAGVVVTFLMQRVGVRRKLVYVAPGILAWAGIYYAGIHPTIAGVLIGLMTPVRAWLGPDGFVAGVRKELEQLAATDLQSPARHELGQTLRQVDTARREAMSPAESLIETLHPWVAFGVMPVFALANAGVSLSFSTLSRESVSIITGVVVGLAVGKPLGVLVLSWLALRLRFAILPAGIGIIHLAVLGTVAGVGFTMALFIAQLAFSDAAQLDAAKLGVIGASAVAGMLALGIGRIWLEPASSPNAALTADEAEASTDA